MKVEELGREGEITWRWCRFEALTVFELEHIYAARQAVFAIEQQCGVDPTGGPWRVIGDRCCPGYQF